MSEPLRQTYAEVFILTNGTNKDAYGLSNFHPASNVNRLDLYLEDGVSTNLVMVNFTASGKGYPTSQWFPALYTATIQHTVTGEAISRTFAKYSILIPPQILQWNANGSAPMPVGITVVQTAGDSLLGSFANYSALIGSHTATEDLYDDNAVAYVYENQTIGATTYNYGFYTVVFDGVSTYSWVRITNPVNQLNLVETKQYNVANAIIQKGNLPKPTSTVTISDEYIRYVLAYLAQVNAIALANQTAIGDEETANSILGRIVLAETDIDNIIDGTQDITYDPTISGLVATTLKEAIDEVVGRIVDIEDDVFNLETNKENVSNKATNFNTVNDTLYPSVEAVQEELDLKEDLENKATTWGTPNDTEYPTTKLVNDHFNVVETAIDVLEGRCDGEDAIISDIQQDVANIENGTTVIPTYVLKVQKIIGLDLQDDILLGEFKTALGNATQIVAGLMSAQDKENLDDLVALLATDDGDSVVNTIGEILAIFDQYPEGADLVTTLNSKVDKVSGKDLSTNDLTDVLKSYYDTAYSHSQITNGTNPHNTTFANLASKPTTVDGYGITDVYTKTYIDSLKDINGWTSSLLTTTPLTNGQTIATATLASKDKLTFICRNTSTGELDTDEVVGALMVNGNKLVFFDDANIYLTIGTTNSTFTTSAGYQLIIYGFEMEQQIAENIAYTPTDLLATNVQTAIDELSKEKANKYLDSKLNGTNSIREIIEGMQLVTNGDFSNGTTGWTASATSSISSSAGLLSNTGNGLGLAPYTLQ